MEFEDGLGEAQDSDNSSSIKESSSLANLVGGAHRTDLIGYAISYIECGRASENMHEFTHFGSYAYDFLRVVM
jgi:hypothetical protein